VTSDRWWGATFVQDTFAVSSRFTLAFGLRHTFQTGATNGDTVAPRFGATWALDDEGRTRIRAGAGLFYNRVPGFVFINALRYDGSHRERVIVDDPEFGAGAADQAAGGAAQRSARYLLPGRLSPPRLFMSSLTVERRLFGDVSASVSLMVERRDDLLRNRIANVPLADSDPMFQYEATGLARRRELQTSVRGSLPHSTYSVTYTAAVRRSDTESAASTPADSLNPAGDYGYSNDDRRHRGSISLTVNLPGGMTVSPYATMASGRPFNVTTGSDNNRDTVFNDRPAFASPGETGAVMTPLGVFNPNPRPGDRLVPRNFGRQGRLLRVDLQLVKALGNERARLTVSATNLFNTTTLEGFTGIVTSPQFGQPRRALQSRRITLSAGLSF
jgi:hypothetical protein